MHGKSPLGAGCHLIPLILLDSSFQVISYSLHNISATRSVIIDHHPGDIIEIVLKNITFTTSNWLTPRKYSKEYLIAYLVE